RNRSHWSTSKTPSYTKSVSWQHHPKLAPDLLYRLNGRKKIGRCSLFWLLEEKLSALAVLHWSDAMTKNAW
ncbi:hypothetical protein, partial [Escherichia coli]|uniref:hypothetical protein n=1 Tax=Escherichia coli TaxID=562 RepID=UPI003FD07B7C